MPLLRIQRDPSRGQLAVFAAAWAVVLSVVGLYVLVRGGSHGGATACFLAALAVPALGWLSPPLLRLVYLGAVFAAWPIGWVLSHVVLALVYYGLLTPTGVVMRLLGRDPLERRFEPAAESYWTRREPPDDAPDRPFRQF